jgi:hypothetical protein
LVDGEARKERGDVTIASIEDGLPLDEWIAKTIFCF